MQEIIQKINSLFLFGKISYKTRNYVIKQIEPTNWGNIFSYWLIYIGTILTISGVICFFAYNWLEFPKTAKLLIIQTLMLISFGLGFYFKNNKKIHVPFVCFGVTLIGVFMAVFGQVYQLKADTYQLFMNWSLLSLPFALITASTGLWALWCIIFYVFIIAYSHHMGVHNPDMLFNISTAYVFLIIAALEILDKLKISDVKRQISSLRIITFSTPIAVSYYVLIGNLTSEFDFTKLYNLLIKDIYISWILIFVLAAYYLLQKNRLTKVFSVWFTINIMWSVCSIYIHLIMNYINSLIIKSFIMTLFTIAIGSSTIWIINSIKNEESK